MKSYAIPLIAGVLCSCSESSRERVEKLSIEVDPSTLTLHEGFNSYMEVNGGSVPDAQVGLIKLGDESGVKFWFVSHHVSRDQGCTKFLHDEGMTRILDGAFCCEVQLAEDQPVDWDALNRFLDTREGIDPSPGS